MFLTQLCNTCDVRALANENTDSVMIAIDRFADEELLSLLREQIQYLILLLKDTVKNKGSVTLPSFKNTDKTLFKSDSVYVPIISGNSVRGIMRRLIMRDFVELIGLEKEKRGIPKTLYHQMFTGGNITESSSDEDIANREKILNLCPPLAVLGSAIGNQTITGKAKIEGLTPQCLECSTGNKTYWEFMGRQFATRLDSSKYENEISIEGEQEATSQMKYEYEVFIPGTRFNGQVVCLSKEPLVVSTFWRMLKLWKEAGYVGGLGRVGLGRLDISIEIPEDADALYLAHLEKVKVEALEYFTVKRTKKNVAEPA